MVFCFFIIISNSFMEEKCVCSIQIWKEVFDHFDRQPKKIEINENYSIDDDAKETLQEKSKRMLVTEARIAALLLLLCYSAYPGKVKRLETKVKRLEKKQRGVAYMSKLINDLVGKQCIIRSEFIFSFAGKTELSCKIIDADDEWIKICYTEKKDKQVVKLMRIENIESIEEQ